MKNASNISLQNPLRLNPVMEGHFRALSQNKIALASNDIDLPGGNSDQAPHLFLHMHLRRAQMERACQRLKLCGNLTPHFTNLQS